MNTKIEQKKKKLEDVKDKIKHCLNVCKELKLEGIVYKLGNSIYESK
jgi:uncharacterized protein YjgD (DUF1641 family)